jgi:hypothetical protein
MNLKLRAMLKLAIIIGVGCIGTAVLLLMQKYLDTRTVLYVIGIMMGTYLVYSMYRILLVLEEMAAVRKNNNTK